jgi:hypothetical protein
MKRLKQLMSAAALSILASTAVAQTTETTPNQITSGTNHTWTGVTTGSLPAGAMPGGPGALYDPATNTIHFSYGQSTVSQTFAINQALQNAGTGIQIRGYNYSWDINNLNYDNRQGGTDTLTARVLTYTPNGELRRTDSWTYNTRFDWTTFSGSVSYANPGAPSEFGNLRVEFSGVDSGFWNGYFGPQVRNVSIGLNYTVNQCSVDPQSSPACPGYKTYYNMWDDGYAQVDLPFSFPFYGNTYTTSYMFTNGVVGFLNTSLYGYCCDGTDLNQERFTGSTAWNFAIYALNTDLYPGQQSTFYTEQTNNGQGIKYTWDRVVEIGTNNENTFSVELRNTGYIGINYQQVNLSPWRNPLIGVAGDVTQGQYSQYYFGPASNLPNLAGTTLQYTGTETTDICAINPLYNSSCPGYQQAYFTQQCSINSLYDPTCPGYAAAYLTYQCNINQLYSPSCPGYQQAYFDQQCSLDPLYNSSCPGYQQAYFTQQCALDGLYDTACSNYADAYYVQQCTLNPLYDTGCTGYAAAYFSQQCTADPLYNNQCPGYAAAYALKYVIPANNTTTTNTTTTTVVASTTASDPVAAAAPLVADPVVNQAITSTSTSASPAQAATATVPLVSAPAATTTAVAAVESTAEPQGETATTETTATTDNSSSTTATSSTDSKDQPKTTRQALAERRMAAARAQAIETGKQLANQMGEAATMEAQVAVQNVVVQAMGFTPGFDAYGKATLPDAQGYRPFEIYPGQSVVDNPQGRRFMTGSDRLHAEMVDQQYGSAQ